MITRIIFLLCFVTLLQPVWDLPLPRPDEGIKPDGDDTETTEVRSEEVSINTVSDEVDADDDSDDGGKTNISFPCNMMVRYLKG